MALLSQWLTNRLIGVRPVGEPETPFYESRILGVKGGVLAMTVPYWKNKGLWPSPGTKLAVTLNPPGQTPLNKPPRDATGDLAPSAAPVDAAPPTDAAVDAAPPAAAPLDPAPPAEIAALAKAGPEDKAGLAKTPEDEPPTFVVEVIERRLKPLPTLVVQIRQDLPLLKALVGRRPCRTLAVTSGKGGTGKTLLSINLAVLLASHGFRIALVDADLGTANVAVSLGLKPQYDLWSVINGRRTLAEIELEGPAGITVIPGGSGLEQLANLTQWQFGKLLGALSNLEGRSDFVIIDTGAGISQNVAAFLRIVREVVLVTHLEPAALLDAYAVIKTMAGQEMRPRFNFLYNRVINPLEVETSFANFQVTAQQFLKTKVEFLGFIPEDPNVLRSVRQQKPLVLTFPRSPASKSLAQIAESLVVAGFHTDRLG